MKRNKINNISKDGGEIIDIIDLTVLDSYLPQAVRDKSVKYLGYNRDGSLKKYIVYLTGGARNYYLSRNTNYRMPVVYANGKVLYNAFPENFSKRVAYVKEWDSLLVEEVEGGNFLEKYLEFSKLQRIDIFRKVGIFLNKLHKFSQNDLNLKENKYTKTLEGITKSISKNSIKFIKKEDPDFYKKIELAYKTIIREEERLQNNAKLSLVFGDMHPANFLINHNQTPVFVDNNDVTMALKERDVGTFLEQIESILLEQEGLASSAEVRDFQRSFLDGYGISENERVIFYRAWISWRNAMYFRARIDPDIEMAYKSLENTKKYLRKLGLMYN